MYRDGVRSLAQSVLILFVVVFAFHDEGVRIYSWLSIAFFASEVQWDRDLAVLVLVLVS